MSGAILIQILAILLCHWIGDFLLQTTDMATNKSKSNYWLTQHIRFYLYGLIPMIGIMMLFGHRFYIGLSWILLNGALHWVTDYFTSRWTSKLYAEKQFYGFPAFFSVIGLDQYIHAICLFTTYTLLT